MEGRVIKKLCLRVSTCIVALVIIVGSGHIFMSSRNAENMVKVMYTFNSMQSLRDNGMPVLKKLCTTEIFKKVDISNTDRFLHAYIQMQGEPCKVNIIGKGKGWVKYQLDCASIEGNREFIFFYESTLFGKVKDMHEYELYAFYNSDV